jgi:hypothetical protein
MHLNNIQSFAAHPNNTNMQSSSSSISPTHTTTPTQQRQVVVPPMDKHRSGDCTYGDLAAMKLPPNASDTKACELFMPR